MLEVLYQYTVYGMQLAIQSTASYLNLVHKMYVRKSAAVNVILLNTAT